MKLTATVTGQRPKELYASFTTNGTEPYTVAELDLDGNAEFIAGTLRALANTIYPAA